MKFVEPSHFTDPDAAARKLVEIANVTEAVQDGRIHIELVNDTFLTAGGSPAEYRAEIERAVAKGWLWRHESGTYVKFTRQEPYSSDRCRRKPICSGNVGGINERINPRHYNAQRGLCKTQAHTQAGRAAGTGASRVMTDTTSRRCRTLTSRLPRVGKGLSPRVADDPCGEKLSAAGVTQFLLLALRSVPGCFVRPTAGLAELGSP
jgi:hypothetical protein